MAMVSLRLIANVTGTECDGGARETRSFGLRGPIVTSSFR
jgi:hypothetical protein